MPLSVISAVRTTIHRVRFTPDSDRIAASAGRQFRKMLAFVEKILILRHADPKKLALGGAT
jgi:hypothetical protein